MLIRLSKNAFVRQYGPFTYVLERIQNRDEMFLDAEPFLRWITREAREKEDIVDRIFGLFAGVDRETIKKDFDEFLAPLLEEVVVLTIRLDVNVIVVQIAQEHLQNILWNPTVVHATEKTEGLFDLSYRDESLDDVTEEVKIVPVDIT